MRKKAYLVGIKGVAMTAMAVYLQEKGYEVTGSDVLEVFPTDQILNSLKIKIKKGFYPDNLNEKYDLVVVTGAHGGMTNPEAVQAKILGFPTYMHGQMIGNLMKGKTTISIAGCHGKTTTSSILATILTNAKLDPSYAIGTSDINGLGPAGHFGKGKYFIAEADEYMTCPMTNPTPRFLWQDPNILVITNIEYDHPDAYNDLNKVKKAFSNLIDKVSSKGIIVACWDNINVRQLLSAFPNKNIITYGFSPNSDFYISKYYFGQGISFMRIKNGSLDLGEYMIRIPGKHNLLNSLAAGIVGNQIGISWEAMKTLLKIYTGCKRRFEKIGEYGNILFYDDYAHHPSEIQATLSAAREWFKDRRIIVIFQPHTFSRTKALLTEFSKSFINCDLAIIPDIYSSAREKYDPTISSKNLVLEINRNKNNSVYKRSRENVVKYLSSIVLSNDLVIMMGAGDIYTWRDEISTLLADKKYEK